MKALEMASMWEVWLMKNEMDLLRMTEPEKLCWLRANRLTLIIVGMIWVSMILQQLVTGNQPWFLIAMIPVFALIRFAVYRFYKKEI